MGYDIYGDVLSVYYFFVQVYQAGVMAYVGMGE